MTKAEEATRGKTRDKLRSNIWRVIHPVVKDLGYDEALNKLDEIIELFDKHIKTSNAEAYRHGHISGLRRSKVFIHEDEGGMDGRIALEDINKEIAELNKGKE